MTFDRRWLPGAKALALYLLIYFAMRYKKTGLLIWFTFVE